MVELFFYNFVEIVDLFRVHTVHTSNLAPKKVKKIVPGTPEDGAIFGLGALLWLHSIYLDFLTFELGLLLMKLNTLSAFYGPWGVTIETGRIHFIELWIMGNINSFWINLVYNSMGDNWSGVGCSLQGF